MQPDIRRLPRARQSFAGHRSDARARCPESVGPAGASGRPRLRPPPTQPLQPKPLKAFTPAQRKAIEFIIKDYLVANPEVFLEIQQALETKMEKMQSEKLKVAITENAAEIFRQPDAALAGNPKGDITVVEFFDYNCGYCKRGFPSMIEADRDGQEAEGRLQGVPDPLERSEEASRVALAAQHPGQILGGPPRDPRDQGPVNEA